MHLWRSKYGPFIHSTQLNYCRRLIVVPLSTLHRLAELIGDPKGELIFLFHTARCGSTLLTQVVHGIIASLLIKKNSHNLKKTFEGFNLVSVSLSPCLRTVFFSLRMLLKKKLNVFTTTAIRLQQ